MSVGAEIVARIRAYDTWISSQVFPFWILFIVFRALCLSLRQSIEMSRDLVELVKAQLFNGQTSSQGIDSSASFLSSTSGYWFSASPTE